MFQISTGFLFVSPAIGTHQAKLCEKQILTGKTPVSGRVLSTFTKSDPQFYNEHFEILSNASNITTAST